MQSLWQSAPRDACNCAYDYVAPGYLRPERFTPKTALAGEEHLHAKHFNLQQFCSRTASGTSSKPHFLNNSAAPRSRTAISTLTATWAENHVAFMRGMHWTLSGILGWRSQHTCCATLSQFCALDFNILGFPIISLNNKLAPLRGTLYFHVRPEGASRNT